MESGIKRLEDYLTQLSFLNMSMLCGDSAKQLIVQNMEHEIEIIKSHPNCYREVLDEAPATTESGKTVQPPTEQSKKAVEGISLRQFI